MAAPADAVWEVRTTGSGNQGGGFSASLAGATGVDYSQQDAAQTTFSDLTYSTISTTVTSAGGGFTNLMLGNTIALSDDATFHGIRLISGFTDTNTITIDAVPDGNSTGGNAVGRIGGAHTVASNGFQFVPTAGNKIWMKSGTYSIASNVVAITAGSVTQPLTVEGYTSTRGDITAGTASTRPIITGALNPVLHMNGSHQIVRNLEIRNTTTFYAVLCPALTRNNVIENCKIVATDPAGICLEFRGNGHTLRRSWVVAGSGDSDAVRLVDGGSHVVEFCFIESAGAPNNFSGVLVDVGTCTLRGNIIQNFSFGILALNASTLANAVIENNVIHRCTQGIESRHAAQGIAVFSRIWANIFSRLTNGIRYTIADISANTGAIQWALTNWDCNAWYSVTNKYVNLPAGNGDLTLTVDPFTDEADDDFSLNSTAGGGAAVRAAPCEVTYANLLNEVSFLAGTSGIPTATDDLGTGRSLWRELTGEKYTPADETSPVPDSVVDIYLQLGAEETNRRLHYHVEDDTSSIMLVAGTQEYEAPENWVEVQIIEHNGRELEKTSVETLRSREKPWRLAPNGTPQFWAHYANKLVFIPAPDAAAVAADATPFVRVVTAVPSVTTNGFAQLPSQEQPLCVMYGAYLWCVAYPDSALAQHRAQGLLQAYERGVEAVGGQYIRRGLPRSVS